MTIGVGASTVELNLQDELRLAKAGLLYADRVRLCSVKSSFILYTIMLGELPPEHHVDLLESFTSMTSHQRDETQTRQILELLTAYKQTIGKRHLNTKEKLVKAWLDVGLEQYYQDVRGMASKLAVDSGGEELLRAVSSGKLDLYVFGMEKTPDNKKYNDEMATEFVELLGKAITDGGSYPLFDDWTGNFIRMGVEEGMIAVSEPALARGRQIGLAAHLLDRLPLFDLATIDEILDIRKELNKPLVRFRQTVIGFSEKIKPASWDRDFPLDADIVFYRDIEPAVLEIEEEVKANRYLSSLTRKFVDKPLVVPGGSALAVMMSSLTSFPDLVSQALGLGLASSTLVFDALSDWKAKKQAIEHNQLYFYYKARKELSKLKKL